MNAADEQDDSSQLPQALFDAVARRGQSRSFPAHAILINEGDSTDSLYIVLSGRVKAYASSEDGREVVLTEYGPGEYFGELSLDGARRSASVKALEPCVCRVVQGPELHDFLAEHPAFAMHLTHKLTRMVRRLTEQVRSLALQDVYSRVVRLLHESSDPVGDERVVRRKLTQQDIADRVGSSREMVNRVMRELSAGGYVVQREGRIVVLRKPPSSW
ncbi:Crp/Fnr family transcriptional regulator [Variovorax sp. OV329]|uniref:Crp/Fnr family transcriptional regulator n=1 Tax=Variovorax sp. OV329 TaxID=1882825 RepID=UPI0008E2E9ED|nr:Crp/Fnr family transcriptional regulator [Variovorax sp. OV329]SFN11934.1 CRP/FNR family transcriptional regulator, cyclic AMP receptor protein [Variovorax sp. OV329]